MGEVEFVTRAPHPLLRHSIVQITGYAEPPMPTASCAPASLLTPLIFSFGAPFGIALGSAPSRDWPQGFASGLFAGPAHVTSRGGAACVQVDLTPAGAVRLFGGAAAELAGAVVELDLLPVWGAAARALCARLAETAGWPARINLAEAFVAARLVHDPSREIAAVWRGLAAAQPIAAIARDIGWSHRHMTARFRRETGIAPVTAARMLRFRRVRRLADAGVEGWAGIAAAAGFADQAHMVREFRRLSGETPTEWARHRTTVPPRLG